MTTAESYSKVTDQARSAIERSTQLWKQNTQKLSEQVDVVAALPQIDLSEAFERYFDYLKDGLEVNRRHREFARGRQHIFFLIDLSELQSIHPTVRKAATETLKEVPLRGIAVCQAPLKARVIAKLIITALNMFKSDAAKNPGGIAGAVYSPSGEIVPQKAPAQPGPLTLQNTARLGLELGAGVSVAP